MRARSSMPLFLALLGILLWIAPRPAHADRIGTPYRGPLELTGSSGGQDSGDSPDTGTGGGDGGGGDGGGGDGGGGDDGGAPVPGGGGPGTERGKVRLDGTILWQWWWEYNKDRFLAEATQRGRANMGSSYYWFGGGAKFPPREIEAVSANQRRDPVFVTLRDVLANDKSAAVRAEAAIALGRLGRVMAADKDKKENQPDNLVVRELIAAIAKDGNVPVRQSALLALGMTRDAAAVKHLLEHYPRLQSAEEKAYANIALGIAGSVEAVSHLLDTLPANANDRSATAEHFAALQAVGLLGPGAVPALTKAGGVDRIAKLTRGLDPIAMQAVNTLARLQVERTTVTRVVGAKSPNVNWAALLALSNYYADEKDAAAAAKTLETSRGAFKSGDSQDKIFSVLALGELARRLDPNSKTRASILKFLQGKDVVDSKKNNYVRAAGAVALGCAGDRTAIPLIAALLDDTTSSDYVIAAACVGLGLLKATPQADKIRETVLQKTKWDADARGYGALGIALMGDTTRLPQLQEFEHTKLNDKTRRQVTLALALLGDKKNVATMAKFFASGWKRNQRFEISNAAYGLAWIRDQSVLDDLVKLATKSSDEQVRGMAVIALGYTGARDRVSPLAATYENQSFRNTFGGWSILDEISKIL